MSNNEASGNLVFYGLLFLIAGFVASTNMVTMLPVGIALYFMLVATNSIERSEKKTTRRLKNQHYRKQNRDD